MSMILLLTWLLHADGGIPVQARPPSDDRELVENLELLELMDESSEYELLEELSVER